MVHFDMEDHKKCLKKLSASNLAAAISAVTGIEKKQAEEDVKRFIVPRLDFMFGGERELYFIFEDRYVETEWKDMISVHYINTSYVVSNTVMRIHLFLENTVDAKCYGGCFTLRTVDDVRFMLSYIYPNWNKISFRQVDEAYVMSYKKKVHFKGIEIEFSTYPLFVQDNAVITCAEASMISMTKYLHVKYDYRNIRILNLTKSYFTGKTKMFPSKGLNPTQMMEIFNYHNIPVECRICYDEPEELQSYIDFCLESAIPVLLGVSIEDEKGIINKHVVQVIGHTLKTESKEKWYIIYDDSGYFIRSFGIDGFVTALSWDTLKSKIKKKTAENKQVRKSFVIYPLHERVYISFEDIKDVFNDLKERLRVKEILAEAGEKMETMRILLVDNTVLKDFLKNKIELDTVFGDKEQMEKEINDINNRSLPHYLWYCEFQTKNINLIFFADPTFNNKTTKNIIVNHTPIISKNVLGLLEKISCK